MIDFDNRKEIRKIKTKNIIDRAIIVGVSPFVLAFGLALSPLFAAKEMARGELKKGFDALKRPFSVAYKDVCRFYKMGTKELNDKRDFLQIKEENGRSNLVEQIELTKDDLKLIESIKYFISKEDTIINAYMLNNKDVAYKVYFDSGMFDIRKDSIYIDLKGKFKQQEKLRINEVFYNKVLDGIKNKKR